MENQELIQKYKIADTYAYAQKLSTEAQYKSTNQQIFTQNSSRHQLNSESRMKLKEELKNNTIKRDSILSKRTLISKDQLMKYCLTIENCRNSLNNIVLRGN